MMMIMMIMMRLNGVYLQYCTGADLEGLKHRPIHILYSLDAVPPIHVVSNHVTTDKLATQNSGLFSNCVDYI